MLRQEKGVFMLTANTNDSQRSVCYDSLRTRGKARSVNQRMVAATAVILAVMALVACDDGQTRITAPTTFPAGATSPTVGTGQTAVSEEGGLPGLRGGTQTVVDAAPATPPVTPDLTLPAPTPVTATGTGEATTSLDALASLKAQALNWQRDVRFALLANVRPGQEGKLLGVALGDPDVFEATPGGEGRNWTLVAVSLSRGAIAVSAEGAFVDLTSEGAVTGEMIGSFADPGWQGLERGTLDLNTLV